MAHDTEQVDLTPTSALSLRELRAEMVSRSAVVAHQARVARRRGDLHQARLLQQQAERLLEIARSVHVG